MDTSSASSGPRRAARRIVAAATGAVLTAVLLPATPAAHAAESYPRPADSVLRLVGHGWGHGRGMSQYGAYGAALAGRSWAWITSFYYPGTERTSVGNPTLRVLVSGGLGSTVRVKSAAGLYASFGPAHTDAWALPTAETTGHAILEYRVTTPTQVPGTPSRALLTYLLDDGRVKSWKLAPGNQINIENRSTRVVSAYTSADTRIDYRGELRGILLGAAGQETMTPVLAVPMESYLRSVVPSEMPASWSRHAVAAQAVAARTYAYYAYRHPRSTAYDICDTTSCQVFNGSARTTSSGTRTVYEYSSSDAAIALTAGVVLTYGGTAAFTEFSSSSGGWTVAGSVPYLRARRDPYDAVSANPNHTWRTSVPVSTLESAWPSIGSLRGLTVTSRDGNGDWGGRVRTAVLDGSAGSVTVSGASLRSVLGLKSEWFAPTAASTAPSYPRDVSGDGDADVLAVDRATTRLRVYRGDGSGGWEPTIVLPSTGWAGFPKVLTAGAWDGDRLSDVLAQQPDGDLLLYPGVAGGSLGAPTRVGTGWQAHNTVFPAGDFDGDGRADLLARRASDGALVLYAGDGAGRFLRATVVGTGWQSFTALLSPGDFDGDGHNDVLARTPAGTLYLYPGDGTGGWGSRRVVGTGWDPFTALVSPGDFDGDGDADVLARDRAGALWLYRGDGAAGWHARRQVGSGWQIFSTILR